MPLENKQLKFLKRQILYLAYNAIACCYKNKNKYYCKISH